MAEAFSRLWFCASRTGFFYSFLVWVNCLSSCAFKSLPSAPKDYVPQAMHGVIQGKLWTYRHAYVDPTIRTPQEEDLVVIFLPFKPEKICDRASYEKPGIPTVMVTVPNSKEAVLLKRGTQRTLQFHFERKGQQWVTSAKTGKIKLNQIQDTKIQGKIIAKYNNELWVAGNFEAVICDYADLKAPANDEAS